MKIIPKERLLQYPVVRKVIALWSGWKETILHGRPVLVKLFLSIWVEIGMSAPLPTKLRVPISASDTVAYRLPSLVSCPYLDLQ
jgi:hypothetical protein